MAWEDDGGWGKQLWFVERDDVRSFYRPAMEEVSSLVAEKPKSR
jgi:hypothetical protein